MAPVGISEEIKSSRFPSNQAKAIINLMYTHNWFSDLHKEVFKKYKLLPQHYNVLRIVKGKYPHPVTPGEIKQVMLDKGPDVTRLVDKLVKLDLVERCQKKENRRIIEIRLSEKGESILAKMTEEMNEMTSHHYGLSESESSTLSDLLDKMRNKKNGKDS